MIESIALVINAIPGMVLGVVYLFLFSGTSLQNTLLLMILCNSGCQGAVCLAGRPREQPDFQ